MVELKLNAVDTGTESVSVDEPLTLSVEFTPTVELAVAEGTELVMVLVALVVSLYSRCQLHVVLVREQTKRTYLEKSP